MQAGEAQVVKADPDAEVTTASTSNAMDVDLTPPKKRAKAALADHSLCRDVASSYPTASSEAASITDAGVEPDSVAETAADAWDTPVVKVEQETPKSSPATAAGELPTPTGDAVNVKSETTPTEQGVTPTPGASSREPSHPPPAKKKKTTASTKKESSSSISTSKSKKASSSTKKSTTSISSSAQEEPSSSRTKFKSEEAPPVHLPAEEEGEEEDNTLYCICQRRQDDVEGGMIMCDRCEQWYHYRCMSMNEADVELVDQFICPPCHQVTGEVTTYKKACKRSGCRHAARTPFSNYCSDRCGVLALEARFGLMKVAISKGGTEVWENDRRVRLARKTDGFTVRTEEAEAEWEKKGEGMGDGTWPVQRLGVAGAFALIVNGHEETAEAMANGALNGITQPMVNGTSAQQSPSPVPSPAVNDATPQASSLSHASSPATSSATSLAALTEQLSLIKTQLRAVDIDKSRINSRLDRLDLRSILLHLVSDRAPTLPPIGSTTSDTPNPNDDEEIPDEPAPKSKKKKGSTKRSKSTTDIGGPRCGYDQRLHWDDAAFDAWAHTEPGQSILAYDKPLDGVLDDAAEGAGEKVICAMAKRKCRRHVDWSNLCEVSLDAEKATLNADSRVLTQTKLELVELRQELEEEMLVVKELLEQQARREKRKEEETDRDLAKAVASQGTRRGVVW